MKNTISSSLLDFYFVDVLPVELAPDAWGTSHDERCIYVPSEVPQKILFSPIYCLIVNSSIYYY